MTEGLDLAAGGGIMSDTKRKENVSQVVLDASPLHTQEEEMSDKPFIKFYPSDFLAGTSGLSPSERGVYMTLLCLIYENDGAIVRDDTRLARRCGAPKAAFARILRCLVAEEKITERDGFLMNNRAEKAIVDRQNRLQNATHAAHSRWSAQSKKIQQNQSGKDAGAMRAQCVGDAIPEPEPEPELEDTKVSSKNKRGSRLKDDWFLPADWGKWAVSEGWPVEVVRDQADRFKDYWCAAPGQKGVKLDWQATWRNWMRNSNAKKTGYANGERNYSNKTDPAIEQIARLAGLSQTPGDGGR